LARDKRLARYAGFTWGLAEGLAFFIVPDVYITFATLFSIRAGIVAWAWSLVGSLVAVLIIWGLVTMLGGGYVAFLQNIPGISLGLLQQTTLKLTADGLPMTPFLVLGGVPLKVYAALAFTLGIPVGAVLLWTVFARIVRIAPVFLFVGGVRWLFRRHVDADARLWLLLFVLAWTAFYAFYFVQMARF
ncbi:MAG TPA: hypothetical protein VGQ52_13925, partial [Gemmatimonadaceae bacterium]|nr:hypothetical protein [Gemmatimonadaceae bacterium]